MNVVFIFISSIIPGLISCRDNGEIVWSLDAERRYLVEFNWRLRGPAHLFTDYTSQVANLGCSRNIDFGNSKQCLLLDIEVLKEDHDIMVVDVSKWC